jgi:PAS domain S-box-containing protein
MERELLQMLIGDALDVITVLDDDGIIRYGSSSTEWVLGYEPGELVGKSLFEFIHPDDVLNVINAFNDGLQIPGCIASFEFRFLHKDSSWRNLDVTAKNLLDNSAVEGIVLGFCDITERVRTEEELHQSIERLR